MNLTAAYRFFRLLTVAVLITVGQLCAQDSNLFGQSATAEAPPAAVVKVASLFSVSSAEGGGTYDAAVVLDIDPGWHVNSARPHQDWLIPAELVFDTVPGAVPHSITYPHGEDEDLLGEKMSVYSDRAVIRFKVDIDRDVQRGQLTLPTRVRFQPCDNQMCQAPEIVEANLDIAVGVLGTPQHEDVFGIGQQAPLHSNAGGDDPGNEIQRLVDKYGTWGYLIALGLAFVTGLLLSFSPCTYPMIPITVSIFAGHDRSVGRGFVLSLFYVGSMAAVYGIMGLIVALVGGVFGAWLASTPVVIGIAAVFVIFSLSMFGVYELQVPMFLRQKLGTAKTGGGVAGAILMGIIAALVVSPCVGPFVAGILLYVATAGSPWIGFLVLFVFALGLGTLFVIIGTFSATIAKLPGAGAWMETVKKFFGFVLLLMAIYFLRTILDPSVVAIVTSLLLLAFGVFGGGLDRLTAEAGFFPRLKKFLGVIALALGLYLLLGSVIRGGFILPPAGEWLPMSGGSTTATHESIPWETDLQRGLERAAAENKPVLIDTWATWCANCRVLEKRTFGHPEVIAEARHFVPIKVQLETADSPATIDFKERFGLKQYTLPTTVLLNAGGEVQRMLRGVVEPEEMLAEMRKLR